MMPAGRNFGSWSVWSAGRHLLLRRRRSEAGFTLLELLVAVALVALVVASLPALFHLARRSSATVAGLDRREAIFSALAFVEARLSEATATKQRDGSGRLVVAFRGRPDRISFVAPLSVVAEESGLTAFELAMADGAPGGLALRWRIWRPPPLTGGQPARDQQVAPDHVRILVAGAHRLAMRYRGAVEPGKPPVWTDSWPRDDVLPDLVELTVAIGTATETRAVPLRLKPPDQAPPR